MPPFIPPQSQPIPESLVESWLALLGQLDEFFQKAIEVTESDKYKSLKYVKGYRAGLETARKLVKSLERETGGPI